MAYDANCENCDFECLSCRDCDSCHLDEEECFSCLEGYYAKPAVFSSPQVAEGRPDCDKCDEAVKEHNLLEECEALIRPKPSHVREPHFKSTDRPCCSATTKPTDSRNGNVQNWVNDDFANIKPFSIYDDKPVWYCHWGHEHDDEVRFENILELDNHLKHHLESSNANTKDTQEPVCRWDSCDTSINMVDDMLRHVKKVHYSSSSFPHQNCLSTGSSLSQSCTSPLDDKSISSLDTSRTESPHEALKCHFDACSFNTYNSDIFVNHLNNHHKHSTEAINISSGPPQGISPFQCEWESCAFVSNDYDEISTHMKNGHHPPDTPDPDESEISMNSLKQEGGVKQERRSLSPISDDDGHFCKWKNLETGHLCNASFASTSELSDHIINAHIGSRKQEYTCLWDGCERGNRSFQQRQKIVRHLQTHTKNKPFKCTVCNRKFAEESVLKQHMRTHSGEKPFECKVCRKKFAASTALSVHLRTHTGEKPLKCKFPGCGKRFSESSNLNKHMKTHIESKSYTCTCCQKQFSLQDQLQRHLKTHLLQISEMEQNCKPTTGIANIAV